MKFFGKLNTDGNQAEYGSAGLGENDPMNYVANLFDLGVVFIVGLIVTLFAAYQLQDLFDEKSEITILKTKGQEMALITKKGKKIDAVKLTKQKAEGRGERLGVAYKLEDGTTVYVPD